MAKTVHVLTKTGALVCEGVASRDVFDRRGVIVDGIHRFFGSDLYDVVEAQTTGVTTDATPDVVSPDELPDDIRDRVKSVETLGRESIDQVVQSVSEAAVAGLRRVEFDESRLYAVVQQIQDASRKVLESLSPSKPKPKPKGKQSKGKQPEE